jgi:hypothetical protein
MPTVSARNQYALAMSRQLCTRPAVWMTDSMPEYASTQLATPMVMTATACGSPPSLTLRKTSVALPSTISGLCGWMLSRPSVIRLRMTTAATTKMPNVTRAFSRMPRMFSPATPQITPRIRTCPPFAPAARKAVPLMTALTAEMQAVRMYDTMIDATATNDATGPSTRYENE